MKRIICAIVLVSMLLSFLPAIAENNLPLVYIADVQSVGDQEITVSVAVSNGTGICGGSMNLLYDSSFLRAAAYQQSDMLTGYILNANLSYAEDALRFSWAGSEELPQNGTLFTVTFERLTDESFETEIIIDKLKLGDAEGNKISCDSENGTVKYAKETASVGGGSHHSFNPKPAPTDEPAPSPNLPFTDVKESDWFYDAVRSAFGQGLMKGVSDTEFAPNVKLTRAMFVTILYRMEGEPVSGAASFSDVESGSWYEKAVAWANAEGIVRGVSQAEFAPDSSITREQMATVIYRYLTAGQEETEESPVDLSGYEDIGSVSDYALPAIRYCVREGILGGKTATTLNPGDGATRAETATVLTRISGIATR